MKRVVFITGSRKWTDSETIAKAIDEHGADLVVHGGAEGADTLADLCALSRNILSIGVQAFWRRFGLGAGGERNTRMVRLADLLHELGIEVVLYAFPLPDSRGTWDCVRKFKRAGFPVTVQRCRRQEQPLSETDDIPRR